MCLIFAPLFQWDNDLCYALFLFLPPANDVELTNFSMVLVCWHGLVCFKSAFEVHKTK